MLLLSLQAMKAYLKSLVRGLTWYEKLMLAVLVGGAVAANIYYFTINYQRLKDAEAHPASRLTTEKLPVFPGFSIMVLAPLQQFTRWPPIARLACVGQGYVPFTLSTRRHTWKVSAGLIDVAVIAANFQPIASDQCFLDIAIPGLTNCSQTRYIDMEVFWLLGNATTLSLAELIQARNLRSYVAMECRQEQKGLLSARQSKFVNGSTAMTLKWETQSTIPNHASTEAVFTIVLDFDMTVTQYYVEYRWSDLASATFAALNISVLTISVLFPTVVVAKQRRRFLLRTPRKDRQLAERAGDVVLDVPYTLQSV